MILAVLPPTDRVEFRPTRAKPTLAAFAHFSRDLVGPDRRLFVNGRPTAIVVPAGYELDRSCRDSRGRVGGAIFWSYLSDGSMSLVVEGSGFVTKPGGRIQLTPITPTALDDEGRMVGIVGSDFTGDDAPYHAELWDGRRLIDLGPAARVWFGRGGAIEGYATTDWQGKPINLMEARIAYLELGQERYVPFTWRDGFRDDGPLLRKPPF